MRQVAVRLIAVTLAVMLAAAGYSHLENGYHFLHSIYSYRIVGQTTGILLAAILPITQLVFALILLFDARGRRMAFLACALLFLVFLVAQVTAKFRGLNIACGCFGGADDDPIGPASLSLAAFGLASSFVGFGLSRKPDASRESRS